MKRVLLSLFLAFSVVAAVATGPVKRSCATMDVLARLKSQDATLESRMNQVEMQVQNYIQNYKGGQNQVQAGITIPVVFHVVYSNNSQNLSDAQCQAQIDQLNADFARLNSDASSTPSAFSSATTNTGIRFCLATTDPNGNPTTGIERRKTTKNSFNMSDGVKFYSKGGLNAWPANRYLNIWSCNLGQRLLGYAQFPGGPASTDGVVVLYSSIGSIAKPGTEKNYNLGRTATHEVGHWLNLYHIWGDDGGGCSGSDKVSDTPNQGAENYGCPSFPKTDACSATSPGVMFMNYMDYVYDNCMNMFTAGQSQRMNALFASGGARAGIVSSNGCQSTPVIKNTSGIVAARNVEMNNTFNEVSVYPNPSRGEVFVNFKSSNHTQLTIKVSDMIGKEVSSKRVLANEGINKVSFDLGSLEKGIYFVVLVNDSHRTIQKLIIDK